MSIVDHFPGSAAGSTTRSAHLAHLEMNARARIALPRSGRTILDSDSGRKLADKLQERIAEMARALALPEEDRELIAVAGWYLLAGLRESTSEPLPHALVAAEEDAELDPERMSAVIACLRALKPEASKISAREKAFHDAAVSMFSRNAYVRDLLVSETGSDHQWIQRKIQLLEGVKFQTSHAEQVYGKKLARNLRQLYHLREEYGGAAAPVIERGVRQSLSAVFRTMTRNQVDLISMADKKAGMLISGNAIVLSLVMRWLGNNSGRPEILVPATVIAATNILTIVMASLAALPSWSRAKVSLEDVRNRRATPLHYRSAAKLSSKDFRAAMFLMLRDPEFHAQSMMDEIHFFSRRAVHKFMLVRAAYFTLIAGMLAAGAVYYVQS